ncbi:MAG: Na+/H+ antiporter subunit D [Hymenobacteraceae bacterium]|nr:Na+/H+ antiporter subunit D [Hymenobacteraceae bacterium]
MSQDFLLVLPLLLPLYGALMCLLFWQLVKWQAVFAGLTHLSWLLIASLLLLETINKGVLSTQVGNWPAPFGITLVSDIFSSLMLLASAFIGFAVYLFSLRGLDRTRMKFGYFPLMLILQMGVSGTCLTGDIFNLYVWFEVMLICCFALISLGGKKMQLEGALKYVTINFLASGLLLTGVGVLYSLFGTLSLAHLAQLARQPDHPNLSLLTIASMFFLTGFGIKSAIFPLFFWLPASYHTPPVAVSAFIAGLITKVGMYTLIRLYTLVFVSNLDFILPLLLVLSGFTMVIGVVGAAAQTDFRKILSFHIISQIGYMLMGLAIYTPLAIAGSVFFILHNILVKTNLFLVSGVVGQRYHTFALKNLGGVYARQPMLALLFLLSALSLAGLPPFSGFWGKFMLASAGFSAGNNLIVATSLFVSLITLLSMTKIWNEVFLKKKPVYDTPEVETTEEDIIRNKFLYLPAFFLLALILFIGFYAQPLIELAQRAATQLLHSEIYIDSVMNKGNK